MQSQDRRVDPAGIVVAGLLALLAGLILWDMSTLQITQTYGVGPKAMPIVVATGLGLLAIGNLVLAFRGGFPEREPAAHLPIILILGGLLAVIVIIAIGGGFIPAVTILFAATAAAFGRRAVLTDLAIGFVLGTGAYLMFSKLLSLSLPTGPLERLF
ncbi:MAG TPA: tripartite tricarboxylate transporter TctB family protein [Xanthobacteraceae bacterium]|nr:tripartite tricarboxylate transporter TctB family protein [Xanthobacteraceae bacterium]